MDRNKLPLEPHHLGVPSGPPKMITEPIVHLTQTVHLSCTNTNTVSKWTEMRFDLTHVTKGSLRVRLKLFLSLWYIWRKLCTYLALTLTPSMNGPK
jgi:hypothetical protein